MDSADKRRGGPSLNVSPVTRRAVNNQLADIWRKEPERLIPRRITGAQAVGSTDCLWASFLALKPALCDLGRWRTGNCARGRRAMYGCIPRRGVVRWPNAPPSKVSALLPIVHVPQIVWFEPSGSGTGPCQAPVDGTWRMRGVDSERPRHLHQPQYCDEVLLSCSAKQH